MNCKCNHCDQQLEFDAGQAGSSVECPGCGMTTVLYRPAATEAAAKPPSVERGLNEFDGRQVLTYLRKNGAYWRQRFWINLAFRMLIALCLLGWFWVLLENSVQPSGQSSIPMLLSAVFLTAGSFAINVLIDIAEVLIKGFQKTF